MGSGLSTKIVLTFGRYFIGIKKPQGKKKNSNNFLWLLCESPTQKEDTVFNGREHPERKDN